MEYEIEIARARRSALRERRCACAGARIKETLARGAFFRARGTEARAHGDAMKIEEVEDAGDARARTGGDDAAARGVGVDAPARSRESATAEMREEVMRLRALRRAAEARGEGRVETESGTPSVEELEAMEPKYYEERRLEYTNGDAYVGECVNETRHGRGRHVCSTGDTYDGAWRDDKRHGRGKMVFVSGLTYEGDWVDDKTCGRGKCAYVNGDEYEGEWKNDHRWGWGRQTFANGDEYEGEWVDDIIEGNGRYTFADGSTFSGLMLSGSRVRGRYAAKDGSVEYDGEWSSENRHGVGKFILEGAFKYIGQWQNDVRHGRGKCEYADGWSYDGEWRDDAFHGQGELKNASYAYVGAFERGKRHGVGVCKFSDQCGEYRGEFADDVESGKGKRLYADGAMYQGEWRAGKRHGKGACAYANGDEYQGEWANDERHGYGVCVFADGTKYRGEWERDCWCQSSADPVFTRVFGPGVVRATAGVAATIGIEARDELKNKRLSGGDIFAVRLTLAGENDNDDAVVEHGVVMDNGDGTYVAYYTCTVAGSYSCEVLIGNDEQCGDSPYDVVVEPARANAKRCIVEGDGTRLARAGERSEFSVVARDEFDNDVRDALLDQLPLHVSITDVSGHDVIADGGAKIEDDGCGRLVVSYAPRKAGFHRLVVSCNDVLIGSSPYSLRVLDFGESEFEDEFSIADAPNDLARDWEIIAKTDFARDGDDFGWATESSDDETEEERLRRQNPDMAIVTNYEDLYKVGRLQKRMKEKRALEQAKKLAEMKAKLEVLSIPTSDDASAKTTKPSLTDID